MSAEFTKITVPSLKETFVNTMIRKIVSGEFQPGDRLPAERDIARQVGVSRSIVNQGLVTLAGMGLVEIRPRHGTFVVDFRRHPTPQSLEAVMRAGTADIAYPLFRDMMDTRMLIERECARLACQNAYETTLDKMQAQVDRMKESRDNTVDAQYRFHYALTNASGNSIYAMIFRGFEDAIRALIGRHYELSGEDWRASADLHQQLLDALRRKDEKAALSLIEQILSAGISVLEKEYS